MLRRAYLGLICIFIATIGFSAGTTEVVTFYSDALGTDRQALIYLPEAYETSGLAYPVIYFVAGHAATAGNWYSDPELVAELDLLIGGNYIDPFILVEADPSTNPWDLPGFAMPSHMTDSELNGDFEGYMVEDVVGFVDTNYRTRAERAHRYIIGRSAGGLGAARLGFRFPEVFGGLGLHVPMACIEPAAYMIPMILAEYPDGPPYELEPTAGSASFMLMSWQAALTPNLAEPPWYVDSIIDSDGVLVEEVWNRLVSGSATYEAAAFAATGEKLDIVMDLGDSDPYLMFGAVLDDVLEDLELPHTTHVFEGDHNTPMEKRMQAHITHFLPLKAVATTTTTVDVRLHHSTVPIEVELPGDIDPAEIDAASVAVTAVNGAKLALCVGCTGSLLTGDGDGDGVDDATVEIPVQKLLRALVNSDVREFGTATVTVRGVLNDDRCFEAEVNLQVGQVPAFE